MEKVIKQLPISKKALEFRLYIIRERIRECEEGIPEEYWCDDCKRLLKKMESLVCKSQRVVEQLSNPSWYGPATPTFKYICSSCGYTWVNNEHLWPPLGVVEGLDKMLRCGKCDGPINEIKI